MGDETRTIEGEVIESSIPPERSLESFRAPRMLISVDEAVRRVDERRDFMRRVLRRDEHYGVIPGTGSKPTLLKPGAEALNAAYGYKPSGSDVGVQVLDFDGRDHNGEPFIYRERKCDLYALHPITGERVWVGDGSGSCSSWEDKYRWRVSRRVCPTCGKPAIIKGKQEYGGGWVCFKKQDGCGAKFKDGDQSIESQPVGRVPNDRVMDLANTILKMADKRALIAATINATGVSDLFTQDLDDHRGGDERDDAGHGGDDTPAPAEKETTPRAGEAISASMLKVFEDAFMVAADKAEAKKAVNRKLTELGYIGWQQFVKFGGGKDAAEVLMLAQSFDRAKSKARPVA